jgi:hypothetical protein
MTAVVGEKPFLLHPLLLLLLLLPVFFQYQLPNLPFFLKRKFTRQFLD